MDIEVADTMADGWQRWLDWHRAIAPDNAAEIKALEADRGRYLGYVRVVGRRRRRGSAGRAHRVRGLGVHRRHRCSGAKSKVARESSSAAGAESRRALPRKSAGLLLFRKDQAREASRCSSRTRADPIGPKKTTAPGPFRKARFADDEEPLAAARREFEEEMGHPADGEFLPLEPLKQPSGKLVSPGPSAATSTHPRSKATCSPWNGRRSPASRAQFPEVDRARWFPIGVAKQKILKGQAPFIDQLLTKVKDTLQDSPRDTRPAEARHTTRQRGLFDENS